MINNSILKYVIALGFIAIAAILAGISVQNLIKAQKDSANVINLSGKQRMHSQRIAFFANVIYTSADTIEIAKYNQELLSLSREMGFIHQSLIYGNDTLHLPKKQSTEIHNMYFEPPLNLNKEVNNYLNQVDVFLNSSDSFQRKIAFKNINTIASNRLLSRLDKTVSQYVKETNETVRLLERRVLFSVISIILVLTLEFFFIFRPLRKSNLQNRKKLIQQNKRLENLNQDLEQFIYAASHDLKTPIRGLYNLMQFLEADFSEELKDKSKEYIQLIKGRVNRINILIDGLMRFGAISRERSTQTEYDINKFIRRFIKNHHSEKVEIKVISTLPTIKTNPIWINEIFSNLIENAIKYNNKSICQIEIGYLEEKSHHKFFIKDNGIGVDKKYHERMFKLFQTLDSNEKNPSAGIGLAIVKKIITELGGKVWISSDVNQHFTVYFTIPKQQEI